MKDSLIIAASYLTFEQKLELLYSKQIKAISYNKALYKDLALAYDNFINFSFYCDSEYPQRLKENVRPPFYITYLGTLKNIKPTVALIGDYSCSKENESIAYKFAKELSLNNISIITGDGRGIERGVRNGAFYGNSPYYVILNHGILNKDNFSAKAMAREGGVLSLSSPSSKIDSVGIKGKNYLLATLPEALIVFSTDTNFSILEIVKTALDLGKEVFVHHSALSSQIGYSLAKEGAKIIDGVGHFLDFYCIERKLIVLK